MIDKFFFWFFGKIDDWSNWVYDRFICDKPKNLKRKNQVTKIYLMALKISEEQKVSMPMKTVASLISIVAIGVWGYFGIIETQNKLTTRLELMEKDLTENTEFRIKWPRGQLGSLPADSEQFMLIEDLYKQVEKLQATQEMNMTNKVNIQFLTKQMEKALIDIEKLKDSNREIKYTNGNGH